MQGHRFLWLSGQDHENEVRYPVHFLAHLQLSIRRESSRRIVKILNLIN